MKERFDGRKGLLCGERIDLDNYDSSVDSDGYIFKSFRSRLTFEFEIPLTAHCNLNCQMCTVFSPVAEKNFVSFESFRKDVPRIAELFGSEDVWFRMVGGEPLLHPEIIRMMVHARELLPHALISITTNGLLSRRMPEAFYRAAKKANIVMLHSPYPPVRTDEKIAFLKQKGIMAFRTVKKFTSRKLSLDVSGSQDASANFEKCGYRCNFIKEGRLSRCFYPLVIEHFNKAFGHHLEVCPNDTLDIHAHSREEIIDFLHKPIDFCRYCGKRKPEFFPWKQSSKSIHEWT